MASNKQAYLAAANNGLFKFFNDTATNEIYTLSLHDALPILQNKEKTTYSSGVCEKL